MLRLHHIMWTFGAYLVVWIAVSISILHMLDVDYHTSLKSLIPGIESVPSTSNPHHHRTKKTVDENYAAFYNFSKCFRQVDYGLLDTISPQVVCDSQQSGTTITQLRSRGWNESSLWKNFALDFTSAPVISPIQNPSEEGGNHDPRYRLTSSRVQCNCDLDSSGMSLLKDFFPSNDTTWKCNNPLRTADLTVQKTALLVARKDDHNPFFQLAGALSSWSLLKKLKISPSTTQIFFLDDGLPMQTDTIFQKVLAPRNEIKYGRDLIGKTISFNTALFLPFEYGGPLVEHLNDAQPCYDSQLVMDFRREVYNAFELPLVSHSTLYNASNPASKCIVTIISRQEVNGRPVARMWLNEDEIVKQMKQRYSMCAFQSIDFATKTMEEQIKLVASSRIIIGMHGAGMANIAFASPNTFVIEIFPLTTFRYGYRNMAQYLDLHYIEFRDGADTAWPSSHKIVGETEWFRTFELVMKVTLNREERLLFDRRREIQRKIHRQHLLDTEFDD